MTDDTIQQIADRAADRIISELAARPPCGLSAEAAKEMPHLLGMLKDIGDGDHSRGVEVFRTLGKFHRRVERIGGIVLYLLVAAMFGAAAKGATWLWDQAVK